MKLLKKILLIIFIILGFRIFYVCSVLEIQNTYVDNPLPDKTAFNLLNDTNTYIKVTNNAIASKGKISTGMYTDGNYENFVVIIEIPYDDDNLVQAWNHNKASIAFESQLQSTKEWIVNNKYKISMYYYLNDDEKQPVIFFEDKWVGSDHRVSSIQPLPEESKGKSIYIKYESVLGSLLFLSNGNDVRFLNNYLAVE